MARTAATARGGASRVRVGVAARILLHGFLLLGVVACSIVLVGRFVLKPAIHAHMAEIAAWSATQATEHRADEARLTHDFATMHRLLRLDLTLYDRDGGVVASTARPPLPPPAATALAVTIDGQRVTVGGELAAVALERAGAADGTLVVLNSPPSLPLNLALTLLFMAILAVAIVSVPLTRSMLQPLRDLTVATRAYADGDSTARAPVLRNDELGDLATDFNHMVEHLETLRRSEKQLLANVSHELRTPLARIRVLLEIGGDGSPAEMREVLPEIAHDLGELERLVDDVLTNARLDLASGDRRATSELPMHIDAHALAPLLARCEAQFRRRHPALPLVVEAPAELPVLRCDPVLLRRAIDNLLENAARYAADAPPVTLQVQLEAQVVRVAVVDRGPGISAEHLAHVCEPFYRVEQSRDRRLGGVGLGLSLARRIVQAHGGTLELASTPAVETRAIIALPLGET